MKAIDLIESNPNLPGQVLENAKYFREEMQTLGFKVFISFLPRIKLYIYIFRS
jgi:hypothetical protein